MMPNSVSTAIGTAKDAQIVMNRSMRTMNEREEFREMAADAMRREPTEEEETLWNLIKDKSNWERQVPVFSTRYNRGWILDLFNPLLKLNIEVDGPQHQKTADARRDRKLLADLGITTIRFTNLQVNRKTEMVHKILSQLLD